MRLRLALVYSPLFIHPSAPSPTSDRACIGGTLPPVIHLQFSQPINSAIHSSKSNSNVDVPKKRILWNWDLLLLKQRIQRSARFFRKRGLPRSNPWAAPDNSKALLQKAVKFLLHLILEISLVSSVSAFASTLLFEKVKSKFVMTNLTRWMAASLFIRMGVFHSRVTSTVPSLARDETSDWFLQGIYRVLLDDSNDNEFSGASFTPVRIRQVPGDGSCLFHAVAAGILYDQSTSNHNYKHDVPKHLIHPPMSEVIDYSSKLRIQAVETLESGMKNNTQVVLQNNETIPASMLVSKAATEYGMTSKEYLSDMQQENVWGGGPEIVALASCLMRQIVLLEVLEPSGDQDRHETYLKEITRFGRPSTSNPIYILSTNQKFPKEYGKIQNHFLALFPSQPF